jgi:hypothetical protein
MINLLVGNGGRVMINYLDSGRMRLLSQGVWQGLSLDGWREKLDATTLHF